MKTIPYRSVLFALSFFISSVVLAQEKHALVISAENVKSRYVKQLSIDVDDVAGHQVRVFEYQRVFPVDAQPVVDGEKIVEQWGRGFSNYANGVGAGVELHHLHYRQGQQDLRPEHWHQRYQSTG